jgi:hypothetical protein
MRDPALEDMTVDQLVNRFVAYALEQDKALLYNQLAKFNVLFRKIEAIEQELKNRPGDQRRSLIDLFTYANAQVRMKAAEATLALEPDMARSLLETIANSKTFPQAGHAGMTLSALDRGIFYPS